MKAEMPRDAGVETHYEIRDVPIVELVDEYQDELRRRGRSAKHIQKVWSQIRKLTKGTRSIPGLTPEKIRRALGRLEVGPKTANYYRVGLHGIYEWLIREGRWTTNPVAAVGRARETERTRIRRALTEGELVALPETSPAPRDAIYLLAAMRGCGEGRFPCSRGEAR